LRWDINPPLKGKNSLSDPFTVVGLNAPATLALAPRGTPLYKTTYGNVAPRIGLAYQLSGRQNWGAVIRGGFGVFYDLGSGSLGGVGSYFPFIKYQNISPTPVPFPLSPSDAAPPTLTLAPPYYVIAVADPNLKLPRTYQWNVAVEQSLGSTQSVSLGYVGAAGRDLLRQTALFDPNANFPSYIFVTDNSATSDYHALQLNFRRRFSKGFQGLASYTFAHSIDIASTDAASSFPNTPSAVASPNVDRGNSDFDVRHSFTSALTYELPALSSQELFRAVLGGWSVDSILVARSAPPVNVVGASSFAAGTFYQTRPNVVPATPPVLYGSQYPGGKAFNPAAFTAAPNGQQGNFGRNVLRGFGAWQADLALQRQFNMTEKVGLRFRAEFFNVFNHPNFGSPNNTVTSPLFGRSTQTLASFLGSGGASGGFSPLYQVGGPRSIQLALKLQF